MKLKRIIPKILIALGAIILFTALTLYLTKSELLQSHAILAVEDNALDISFEINEKERYKFKNLSDHLNLEYFWDKPISIKLDEETLKKIDLILPKRLNLEVDDKTLSLSTPNILLLSPALGEDIKIATGNGELKMKINNEQDFYLEVQNPKEILEASPDIYLSNIAKELFPMLGRVDRIDLRVQGINWDGKLILK